MPLSISATIQFYVVAVLVDIVVGVVEVVELWLVVVVVIPANKIFLPRENEIASFSICFVRPRFIGFRVTTTTTNKNDLIMSTNAIENQLLWQLGRQGQQWQRQRL